MGQLYITNYANEIAYREDNRRTSNGAMFRDIFEKCMKTSLTNGLDIGKETTVYQRD